MIASPLASSIARPAAERAHVASSLDPDAAAYVAALVSAGASVSPIQRAAIGAFVVGEKSALRWDSIKRLYLPIWGVAAANAICLRSLTSGTFTVSGVTHAAGYVQGNGTTGYFDTGASPSGTGVSLGNGMLIRGIYQNDSNSGDGTNFDACGSYATGSDRFHLNYGPSVSSIQFYLTGVASSATHAIVGETRGIHAGWGTAANRRIAGIRTAAGFVSGSPATGVDSAAVSTQNVYFLARNGNGAAERFSDGREFVWLFGNSPGDAGVAALTLSLKTLWETCTGLTLP